MERLFADYPQALANTAIIARRCDVELPLGAVALPRRQPALGRNGLLPALEDRLRRRHPPLSPLTAAVTARLQRELAVIEELGFAPVLPHRRRHRALDAAARASPCSGAGSAGDSLVAYVPASRRWTPLAHGLYFERFLNAERPDPPDIDLDLCWRRRDEVLNYVYDTYGADHVAMIGTHIRFQLRSAWRDVAKAHGCRPEGVGGAGRAALGLRSGRGAGRRRRPGRPTPRRRGADPGWGPTYPPAAETGGTSRPAPTCPRSTRRCWPAARRSTDARAIWASIAAASSSRPSRLPMKCPCSGPRRASPSPSTRWTPSRPGAGEDRPAGQPRAQRAQRERRARARERQPLDLDAHPLRRRGDLCLARRRASTLGCFQLEAPACARCSRPCSRRWLGRHHRGGLAVPAGAAGRRAQRYVPRAATQGTQPDYLHPAWPPSWPRRTG